MSSLGYGLDPYGDPNPSPVNPGYGSPPISAPPPEAFSSAFLTPEVYIVETTQRSDAPQN